MSIYDNNIIYMTFNDVASPDVTLVCRVGGLSIRTPANHRMHGCVTDTVPNSTRTTGTGLMVSYSSYARLSGTADHCSRFGVIQ